MAFGISLAVQITRNGAPPGQATSVPGPADLRVAVAPLFVVAEFLRVVSTLGAQLLFPLLFTAGVAGNALVLRRWPAMTPVSRTGLDGQPAGPADPGPDRARLERPEPFTVWWVASRNRSRWRATANSAH